MQKKKEKSLVKIWWLVMIDFSVLILKISYILTTNRLPQKDNSSHACCVISPDTWYRKVLLNIWGSFTVEGSKYRICVC